MVSNMHLIFFHPLFNQKHLIRSLTHGHPPSCRIYIVSGPKKIVTPPGNDDTPAFTSTASLPLKGGAVGLKTPFSRPTCRQKPLKERGILHFLLGEMIEVVRIGAWHKRQGHRWAMSATMCQSTAKRSGIDGSAEVHQAWHALRQRVVATRHCKAVGFRSVYSSAWTSTNQEKHNPLFPSFWGPLYDQYARPFLFMEPQQEP